MQRLVTWLVDLLLVLGLLKRLGLAFFVKAVYDSGDEFFLLKRLCLEWTLQTGETWKSLLQGFPTDEVCRWL